MRIKKIPDIRYGLAFSVALITFLVYLPAIQNAFVEWDDNQYVFENTHIHSMNAAFFRWAFTTFHAGNWHPLTWISHALDYAIWGLNPLGHHLTNNILHSINAFLVVLLVVRLIETSRKHPPPSPPRGEGISFSPPLKEGDKGEGEKENSLFTIRVSEFTLIAAGVTGLLFGIHPIHVESVAWVSERKDLLCALFFLLSIMMYMSHVDSITPPSPSYLKRGWRSRGRYLLSLLFFTLALLSKPMAVSLPVVLLVLDWCPFNRINSLKTIRAALIEKLPFIALSFGSSLITILAQKEGGAMLFMENVPLSTRLLVSSKSLLSYLSHMLLPVNLVPYYPYPNQVLFSSPEYISAVSLVIIISAATVYLVNKQRLWPAVWVYYVVTLIPVLGIVQVGSQAMADRYTYLPGIGPFLACGLGVGWLYVKYSGPGEKGLYLKLFGAGTAVFLLLALPYLTIRQISVWRNSITLWSYVIEKEPDRNYFAYSNRGVAFTRAGEFDRAVEDFRKSIDLNPGYADAYSNMGAAYYNKGMSDQAIACYRAAIRLNPEYFIAHRNLATALYMSGRIAEALEHYRMAANLRSEDPEAHTNLGASYAAIGSYERAIEHLQTALRLEPDFADAHYNLAAVYNVLGRTAEAREHFETARRLNPQDVRSPDAAVTPLR